MRHDLGKSASIRRSLEPTISDRLRELPQLRVRPGDEIQHFREPSTPLEPQVKGLVAAQHVRESGVDERIFSALIEEREEHRDVAGTLAWAEGASRPRHPRTDGSASGIRTMSPVWPA